MNILYIILKHVTWRFQIYNLFREKFKFRGFTKAFTNFAKYIIAFIFAKFKYVYVYICVCIYMCIYIYVYIYICVYIYIAKRFSSPRKQSTPCDGDGKRK